MNLNAPRTSHPSSAQVETLVEFMERNPGLAKGFLRTQNARERSRRQWEELAVRLNSLGGTIKNYKQWTKYWSDKKSAIKKKVATRSAARRRTGGGVEDEVELSELEERIVTLCGGEGFSTGDTHLGIQPFAETNSPSSPIIQAIQDDGTDNIDVHQQQNLPVEEPSPVMILGSEQFVNTHDTPVARRLFHSSSSPAVGTSQHILQGFQSAETVLEDAHVYHPSLSPPGATLSHTPTPPVPIPSPSRRGSTQVVRDRYAASSSSRRATFDTQSNSPSRRTRPHIARSRRGAGSVSSHQTTAHPPSQRRTEFSTFTERFLRVEEQQLEIQRSNSHIVQSFLERSGERERALIEAVAAVGKGLEALARAIKRD